MFLKMRALVGEGCGAAQVLGVLALGLWLPWQGGRRSRARPLVCKSSDRGTALTLEPQDDRGASWLILCPLLPPPSVPLNFGVACCGDGILTFNISEPAFNVGIAFGAWCVPV